MPSIQTIARAQVVFEGKDDATRVAHKVSQSFNETAAKAELARTKTDGFFDSILSKASSILNPLTLVTVGVGALTGGLGLAVKAADEEAQGIARLDTVLKNSISGWNGNRTAVEAYITKMQNLAFADDELRDSLGFLIGQTKDLGKAQELQSAAMDLARAKKIDLMTATKAVSKVDQDSIGILKKLGIQVTENMTSEQALLAIRQQTAGQAEAYAATAGGAMERLQTIFGNVTEDIGNVLLPRITGALSGIADAVSSPEFQAGLTKAIDALGVGLSTAADLAKGAFDILAPAVGNLAKFLKDDLWPILTNIITFFKDNWITTVTAAAAVITAQLIPALVTFATVTMPAATLAVQTFLLKLGPIGLVAIAAGVGVEALSKKLDDMGIELSLAGEDGILYKKKMVQSFYDIAPESKPAFDNIIAAADITAQMEAMGLGVGAANVNGMTSSLYAGTVDVSRVCSFYPEAANVEASMAAQGHNNGAAFADAMAKVIDSAIANANAAIAAGGMTDAHDRARPEERWLNQYRIAVPSRVAVPKGGGGGRSGGSSGTSKTADALKDIAKDNAKEAQEIIAEQTRTMNGYMDAMRSAVSTLSSMTNFVAPTEAAMDTFFNSLDMFTTKLKDRLSLWWGRFNSTTAEAAQGVGGSIAGVMQAFEPLNKLGSNEFTAPKEAAIDTFLNALDMFTEKIKDRLSLWLGRFSGATTEAANGVGAAVSGIMGAFEPLHKLGSTQFTAPTEAALDAFLASLDLFTEKTKDRLSLWIGRFSDTTTEVAENVSGATKALLSVVEPIMKLANFKPVSPLQAGAFFDTLDMFLLMFSLKADEWYEKATASSAELAARIGVIAENISKALDPILKMADVQKVTREQIEGAFSNLWFALHQLGEVMKSGELQGDAMGRLKTFAVGIGETFEAVGKAIGFLTDKKNPEGIVGLWKEALDYMDYYVFSLWGPYVKDHIQFWFDQYTVVFREYTSSWVEIWRAAFAQMTLPASPGAPVGGGGGPTTIGVGFNAPASSSRGSSAPTVINNYGPNSLFVDGQFVTQLPADTHASLVSVARRKSLTSPGKIS